MQISLLRRSSCDPFRRLTPSPRLRLLQAWLASSRYPRLAVLTNVSVLHLHSTLLILCNEHGRILRRGRDRGHGLGRGEAGIPLPMPVWRPLRDIAQAAEELRGCGYMSKLQSHHTSDIRSCELLPRFDLCSYI